MKMIMWKSYNKCWFIYLLIMSIHVWTIHSYGDAEFLNYINDVDGSKKVTFENLIESMNDRHRIRRAAGDPTMVTDATTITPELTTWASTVAIYIITGESYLGTMIETTTDGTQTNQVTSMTTNPNPNGTYIITAFFPNSTIGTTQSTTSTSTTPQFVSTTTTPPNTCNNGTHVTLSNGTCVSRESLITSALNTLNNSSANDTEKANAISTYIIAVTNSNISTNSSNSLTIGQIDEILGNLNSSSYNVSTNDSIIVITQPRPCEDVTTIIGASFETNNASVIIDTKNIGSVTDSSLRAAGIVNLTDQCTVSTFNMLIINNPTSYQHIDNVTNSILVSSIIIAKIKNEGNDPPNIVINLYFQDLTSSKSAENGNYRCTFYDTNTLQWSTYGCSEPIFNTKLARYECQCYHLTSFALIWLPQPLQPPNGARVELDAQDKASIAFQAASILCFLGIIIHGITVRIKNPQKYTQSRHLLPLVSCGITMILFIFYIALGLTVYTRYASSNTNVQTSTQRTRIFEENFNGKDVPSGSISRADSSSPSTPLSYTPCLPSEHGLMFTVYFLIIFMFCSKTSIGYYNYRHYVQLFPPPKRRILILTISISLLISVIWLAFAAGFNSNPSNEISEVYLDKICWFSRGVIHYFLTIPICLFLAINLAMFIPVAKHNIQHEVIQEMEQPAYNRRKRCIYILLLSCMTQGFGWLFGPLILVASPTAAEVLGWFFIIFNGLEGVWAILLYIVLEKEGMNENERDRDDRYRGPRDNEDNELQIELDDIRFDRRRDQLAMMKSDSPRNSFANYPTSQAHHRRYQVDDNDRL